MYKEIELMEELDRFAQDKEMEIENMCNSNTQDFVQSVNQLLTARSGTVELTTEILNLNTTIHKSTDRMVEAKKALVDSKGVRQNIDETTQALNSCLEVLQLANRVHELIQAKKHYAALRTLDELQNVHLRDIMQYGIADMIQKAVPAMQRMVKDAVSVDLNTWLFHVKEISESLGQIAFDQTFLRRKRQQERPAYARGFKLNSAIELVLDEREEFDILDNKEIKVDFTPLHECLHIHEALGQREEFRFEFADTRRKQKDLLLPPVLTITEEEDTGLNQFEQLLGGIAGFAIIERATVKRTQNFRSQTDVRLPSILCQTTDYV
jgi:exocyst complex component 6